MVNSKRKILNISQIQKSDRFWDEEDDQIVTEVIEFYQKQFTGAMDHDEMDLINQVLYLITEENNYLLYKYPTKNETKKVDFDLKGIVLVD